jgi:hypothetical protein
MDDGFRCHPHLRVPAGAGTLSAPAAPSCAALLIPCPRCTDGIATTNDPSSPRRCEACDGTGTRELCCSLCGDYGATEFIGRWPFHTECAEEQRADALWMSENVA